MIEAIVGTVLTCLGLALFISAIGYLIERDVRVRIDQWTGLHKVYKGFDVESGKRFAIFHHPDMFDDCYEISERRKCRWVIVDTRRELPSKSDVEHALLKQSNWRRELDNMAYRDMDD